MTVESVRLTDSRSGAEAHVLAGFGMNCYAFRVPVDAGPLEVLWAEPEFASGQKRPSGSGIPLLFPFPGRIHGTTFPWEGRRYEIPEGDGQGNAIHGFVHCRPWRVIERSESSVTGQFHASVDDPELLDRWPADFRIAAHYALRGRTLHLTITVDNPGRTPLPFGLGAHPYFRLPLGGPEADGCLVRLPVRERWELEGLLPTGRREPVAEAMGRGVPFGQLRLDAVFTGLSFDDGWAWAELVDPHSSRRVRLRFDRAFRELVVYTPPHREAICIEPYTCAPDPFWLARRGVDGGQRVLAPGQSFQARMEIAVD